MEITPSPKRIAKLIGFSILGLTIVNSLMEVLRRFLGHYPFGYQLIDLDSEQNLPTWYSSCLLLVCAGLLAIVAQIKHKNFAPYRYHWSFLSLTFVVLSLDEIASIHNRAIEPLRSAFHLTGLLYFSWVIPGILVVILLGLAYLKFLTSLPQQIRHLFLLSGLIYVSGAIGMEMIGGVIVEYRGLDSVLYQVAIIVEEFLEMIGVNLFIYALMTYLCSYLNVRIYGLTRPEIRSETIGAAKELQDLM